MVMILHRILFGHLRLQREWSRPRKLEGLICSWTLCDSRMSKVKVSREVILKAKKTWFNDADIQTTRYSARLWAFQIYFGSCICHAFVRIILNFSQLGLQIRRHLWFIFPQFSSLKGIFLSLCVILLRVILKLPLLNTHPLPRPRGCLRTLQPHTLPQRPYSNDLPAKVLAFKVQTGSCYPPSQSP